MSVTCHCGKVYSSPEDKGYDDRRKRCADGVACLRRATAGLPSMKPFVGGFDQLEAYTSAPKLGDAA